ncbi:MAG: phosphoribosylformylglycinamidine cyclo-ligase, partial [Arcobacteraceae bacterium]|nr:phosphoribosylformylglycinamidine cyclo-ligase [Arcobacteraceae bacterium]
GIGGFSGVVELPDGRVMGTSTDGVGTKLVLAIAMEKHDTVGIDLVAMCVNDLIVAGILPSIFLDYIAMGKQIPERTQLIVEGIIEGCNQAKCALLGGEMAEMPGIYGEDDYDLAGFAVGVAEKSEMDRVSLVRAGHKLIALPSSGLHSNGFSLARKVLFDKMEMKFEDDFNGKPLIETLLEPTRIYVKEFKENKENINALAHITGGGIVENIPRVLPDNLRAVVQKDKVQVLPIFKMMGEHVEEVEMYRAFNMGVGMIFVANPSQVDTILEKTDGYVIGNIISGEKGCDLI